MTGASYEGQRDFFDPELFQYPVHIIGMGGIGGTVALPLVKHGIRSELHLWDKDTLAAHNLPGQMMYRPRDLGASKIKAAAKILEDYKEPELDIITHDYWVDEDTDFDFSGVVISGVDSMAARNVIWPHLEFNPEVALYMDGRIGGEFAQLFTLDPNDDNAVNFYSKWLFGDDRTTELPCSARTNSYAPLILASRIIMQLSLFARGEPTVLKIDDDIRHSTMETCTMTDGTITVAQTAAL